MNLQKLNKFSWTILKEKVDDKGFIRQNVNFTVFIVGIIIANLPMKQLINVINYSSMFVHF